LCKQINFGLLIWDKIDYHDVTLRVFVMLMQNGIGFFLLFFLHGNGIRFGLMGVHTNRSTLRTSHFSDNNQVASREGIWQYIYVKYGSMQVYVWECMIIISARRIYGSFHICHDAVLCHQRVIQDVVIGRVNTCWKHLLSFFYFDCKWHMAFHQKEYKSVKRNNSEWISKRFY
jgi:hypothetical protein